MNAGIFNNLDVKGVKEMNSSEKCPENIMKGLLRLTHDISTFRDGTIRFDMVDISMTHFKPSEVGLSVSKAKKLGYEVKDENEIVELYYIHRNGDNWRCVTPEGSQRVDNRESMKEWQSKIPRLFKYPGKEHPGVRLNNQNP